MFNQDISVVINYSTNDHKFLYPCIKECLKFSNDIVVSYTTHMYNGEMETLALVESAEMNFKNNSSVNFNAYAYDHEITKEKGTRYWHNHARYSGWKALKGGDYVLFLDVDEIPDAEKINNWLGKRLNKQFYYLMAYWYFRKPIYQATTVELTSLLIDNDVLYEDLFYNGEERRGMIGGLNGQDRVFGLNGEPMIHHYSWVRSKKRMLKKVESWGHNQDRDWKALIEEEFSHEFDGTDFVHGYNYNILDEPFKEV